MKHTVMQKKTILFISDHQLSTSGVGTQARWLINGLLATGKYKFRCFGGAVKHDNYDTVIVNEDFIIKPTDGFGDKNILRKAIAQEKPDAIVLFTDPRFFSWVWEMEDEIHSICPIAYNHLWDNPPWPEFNRVIYESTDLINCINWPTYEMVSERFPDKTNYIPHAVPGEVYFPMPDQDALNIKQKVLGKDKADHFVVTYVSRNARRKMPSDIILSYKIFLDSLEKTLGHKKSTMIMHTDPLDPEGPNLHHVIDMLNVKDNVVFSKDRTGFQEMNYLYNVSDVVVNRSCNEGFGLGILEAKMAAKPVIAIKTGGLTRQVQDHITGEEYGVALEPDARSLVGNQMVPYIFEDYVTHQKLADAMMTVYNWGKEKRKEIGNKSRKHALREYSMEKLVSEWDRTLSNLIENWKKTHKGWELIEI